MKKFVLLLFILSRSSAICVFSQQTQDNPAKIRADFYKSNAVFVRTLKEHNPKKTTDSTKNEDDLDNSAYFFRINPEPLFKGDGFDIIEVFKSERYFQKTFERIYDSGITYQNDRDGFHYFAKFIYNQGLVRLEVYPELITNVCTKKMHFNSRNCNYVTKKSNESGFELHKKTIVNLLKQLDSETVQSEPDSTYNYNLKQLLTKKEVKFQTEIKSFKVVTKNNEVQNLVKEFTKYSLSDDEILNNSYTLDKLIIPDNSRTQFSSLVFQKGAIGTGEDIPLGDLPPVISESKSNIISRPSSAVIAQAEALPAKRAKCIENATKNGWIYAGKVTKNTQDLMNLNNSFVKNKAYIKQNETKCWSALTDIYVRNNAPIKMNNNWQKGDEKGVLKEGVSFNINDFALVLGEDDYPLLWLNISYE